MGAAAQYYPKFKVQAETIWVWEFILINGNMDMILIAVVTKLLIVRVTQN